MEDRKRVTRSKDTKAQSRYSAAAARHQRHQRPLRPPLIDRAARAATAAYQLAMTSLYQQESRRLREENAWLRNEVRHCWDAIEVMGHDLESRRREFVLGELSRADAREQTAVVDQRRLLEVHLREQLAAELEEARRGGYAKGYVAGVLKRLSQRPGKPAE
ncbi:hypothetical protein [Salinispora arenicola]|uniref:hypothetical protein n=1 Tax=Salinispora arenicola TaxID=168697 RepID=UPI0018AD5D6F|nr:hypothetical protein [Salinispora arenicola]